MLKKLLQETKESQFKNNIIFDSLSDKIKKIAVDNAKRELSNTIIQKEGIVFKILGIKARYDARFNDELRLNVYIIASHYVLKPPLYKKREFTKIIKERINKRKKEFEKHNCFLHSGGKTKFSYEFGFDLDVDEVLSRKKVNYCFD